MFLLFLLAKVWSIIIIIIIIIIVFVIIIIIGKMKCTTKLSYYTVSHNAVCLTWLSCVAKEQWYQPGNVQKMG